MLTTLTMRMRQLLLLLAGACPLQIAGASPADRLIDRWVPTEGGENNGR